MTDVHDLVSSLDEQNQTKNKQQEKQANLEVVNASGDKVVSAVEKGTQETVSAISAAKSDTSQLAKTQDVNQAVEAIKQLNLTTFMQNEGLPQLANNLSDLADKTQILQDKLENEGLKKMSDQLGQAVKKLDDVSKTLSKSQVTVDAKLQKTIDNLSQSINKIDFNPSVNVSAPDTKVVTTPIDLKPLLSGLTSIEQAIKNSEKEETPVDFSVVTAAVGAVEQAIQALRFPVPNYVLPFQNNVGKATQVVLDANGNVPISGNITASSATIVTSNTPTVTQVASSASNITLLALNASRKMAMFFNDSTQILYLKLGATASTSSYTVKMAAGAYYELPAPIWTGKIDGIWASSNGNALVTEET